MKKVFNTIYSSILIVFMLLLTGTVKKANASSYYRDKLGNWIFEGYESKLDEDYYSSLNGITNQTQFISTLHNIIASTHTHKFTYGGGSNETGEQLKYLDEDPLNTSNVLCMYTGVSYSKSSLNSSWNQEHTWAKSHGFPTKGKTAYRDLNHLRATEMRINSSRSNSDFGELTNAKNSDSYGNFWNSGTFEPRDCVKGDVARIMMYMDIRYNGDSMSDGVNLTLVNHSTSTNDSGQGEFGYLDTLLEWHMIDPVDDYERRRNDRVEELQGNRNPFIDHPEYANVIYGCDYEEESGYYSVSYSIPSGATFNYSDSTKYEENSLIKEPTITPTYKEGYEFLGWYKDSTFKTKWNFSSDKISSKTILYALFIYNPTPELNFKYLSIYNRLSFKYKTVQSGNMKAETIKLVPIGGLSSNNIGLNSSIDISKYFDYDNSLFSITGYSHSREYFMIKEGEIRLYNYSGYGSEITIDSLHDDLRFTNCKVTSSNDTVIQITVNNNKVSILNTNNSTKDYIKVTEIELEYETGDEPEIYVKDLEVDLKIDISNELLNDLINIYQNPTFGINVNGVDYDVDLEENAVKYSFDVSDYKKEYTVYGYVKLGVETFKTELKTISAKSISINYLENIEDEALIEVLEYISR